MPVKTIVNRLEYSKLFFLPAMFCFVLPQLMKHHNSLFYALETLLAGSAVIALLFRLFYAPLALRRSEDPGLLYSTLEILDRNSLWFAQRFKPEESYKPYFSTSRFLTENNLSPDISYGKPAAWLFPLLIIPNLAAVWFVYVITHQPWIAIAILVPTTILLLQLARRRKQALDPNPPISFTEQGLRIEEDKIPWKDIYEWQYNAGGKNERSKYIISYTNAGTGIADRVIELPGLNTNRVDFLLLLIYFKAKYGQQ